MRIDLPTGTTVPPELTVRLRVIQPEDTWYDVGPYSSLARYVLSFRWTQTTQDLTSTLASDVIGIWTNDYDRPLSAVKDVVGEASRVWHGIAHTRPRRPRRRIPQPDPHHHPARTMPSTG